MEHLMLTLRHSPVAVAIVRSQQEVDALQCLRLQLVQLVVEHLQARNVDDAGVVWRARQLDADAENLHEDGGRQLIEDQVVVHLRVDRLRLHATRRLRPASLLSDLLDDAVEHAHEGADDVEFLHDRVHLRVLSDEQQLVAAKCVRQRHNVRRKLLKQLLDEQLQLGHAVVEHDLLQIGTRHSEHDLGEHETAFNELRLTTILLALQLQLLNSLDHAGDAFFQFALIRLLQHIQLQHLLKSLHHAELGLQVQS